MGKEVLVPMYNCWGLKRKMVPVLKFAVGIGLGFLPPCHMSKMLLNSWPDSWYHSFDSNCISLLNCMGLFFSLVLRCVLVTKSTWKMDSLLCSICGRCVWNCMCYVLWGPCCMLWSVRSWFKRILLPISVGGNFVGYSNFCHQYFNVVASG